MGQGGEGPRTGAQVSQTTEAQPPCPETALEEKVTQRMGPPSGSPSRRGRVREKRQQVCSTRQQSMSGREEVGRRARKGQAGHRCSGTALTPPKPLTARRKGEGSRRGMCPQGPEGCRLRVSGSGRQPALTSSALSQLGLPVRCVKNKEDKRSLCSPTAPRPSHHHVQRAPGPHSRTPWTRACTRPRPRAGGLMPLFTLLFQERQLAQG